MLKKILKQTIVLNAVIWLLSPWMYVVLRISGVINGQHDWLVFTSLVAASTITAFLTFGND